MRPASARAKAFIIVTARSHRWLGPKKPTLPWVAISRACMACIGLVYLRDGDSLIARDYRPLLQQWLPEGTKIVQTRGECPRNSEEAEYMSAQVYQLTLPGKKPLWVEVGAFGKADYSPAPNLTFDFALSPPSRWACLEPL